MSFKKSIKKFLSRYPLLDYIAKCGYTVISRIWFSVKYREVIKPNSFFFESFQGRSASDSPRAIYDRVRKEDPSAICIWAVNSMDNVNFKELFTHKNTVCVVRNSPAYFKALSECQYLIFNSRTPFLLKGKPNQRIIQCWHGTPLKKLGYDLTCDNQPTTSLKGIRYAYSLEAKKCKYFVSPSPHVTACLKSAFLISDEQILELGYPRNDELVVRKQDKTWILNLKKKLGLDLDKKIILYAPTFRDNKYDKKEGFLAENKLSTEAFLKFVKNNDYVVLFRGHYFTKADSGDRHFIDVSRYGNINELMLVSDILITDYSSLMFDYLLLEKPIFLYMYDKEEYSQEVRGIYLDLNKDIPGKICHKEKDLIDALNDIQSNNIDFTYFNKRYNPYEDGDSSLRVLEKIKY
ncbi:CDP-glycerol:poly(glycerophosphate) glycerophosphotransferase [Phocoenobacter uteri]|uniref:CDP-glycerol:poly(Glycerophosphate) glycerophosphotransferase n=1 Tax=Phocoenobacter uteri TaxID=146806 RepID=A0A379CAP4_9PAST|nr:CDP-glycerol glycerophosphotransferase family protein [Phocoenobacter uteri]MDG6881414.1 hypothetical protein [Phocoenobacter uteri]SUB59442.1 CDP-glycerol:poly(glycerophosphate) glycerophosphotransferase [Phocoenobacter uteri]